MNVHTCNEKHTIMAGATNILQKRFRNDDETSNLWFSGIKDRLVNCKM